MLFRSYLVAAGAAGSHTAGSDTAGGPEQEALTADLREWLPDQLPQYLVPGRLVVLPRFPLDPNGKVDRAALPLRDRARPEQSQGPRDDLERTLSDIWCQVLGRPQAGIEENFFEIGGDSLKSIQVVHRAREAGLVFRVIELFNHPTVRELADQLRQQADR